MDIRACSWKNFSVVKITAGVVRPVSRTLPEQYYDIEKITRYRHITVDTNGEFSLFASLFALEKSPPDLDFSVTILRGTMASEIFDLAARYRSFMESDFAPVIFGQLRNNMLPVKTLLSLVHDLKSPLSSLPGLCEVFTDYSQDPRCYACVEITGMMSQLADDILSKLQKMTYFSRTDSTNMNIIGAIEKYQVLFREKLSKIGSLSLEIDADLEQKMPLVTGRPYKVSEIFENLLNNAVDAIESKFSCGLLEQKEGKIVVSIFRKEILGRQMVAVKIRDNGCGFSEEQLQKVFSERFSTKGDKGSGLGLINVIDAVHSLDGRIDFTSEIGVGTEFTVELPIADQI